MDASYLVLIVVAVFIVSVFTLLYWRLRHDEFGVAGPGWMDGVVERLRTLWWR